MWGEEIEGKRTNFNTCVGEWVFARVRGEYGFVESLTLLSQRLNARGGRGRRYGVGGRVEVWGRRERGRVYEAYEVKNKRQKLRCLLLRRKKKIIIFLFMM